jgi:putative phosphoribosyl transferase
LGDAPACRGIVLFAHGGGSGRFGPRNHYVAAALRDAGLATVRFDLLTEDEAADHENVFDLELLAERLRADQARSAARSNSSR